jgi:hypothetical protein
MEKVAVFGAELLEEAGKIRGKVIEIIEHTTQPHMHTKSPSRNAVPTTSQKIEKRQPKMNFNAHIRLWGFEGILRLTPKQVIHSKYSPSTSTSPAVGGHAHASPFEIQSCCRASQFQVDEAEAGLERHAKMDGRMTDGYYVGDGCTGGVAFEYSFLESEARGRAVEDASRGGLMLRWWSR